MFNLKASFQKPSLMRIFIRSLFFALLLWIWVFIKLLANRPKVVHACDLDTLPPCYAYKLLFRKKLVFDVFDRYGMAIIPQRFKKLCALINYLEEGYGKYSDALIIAGGQKVLGTFKKRPKRCEILLNCPEDYFVNSVRTKCDDHNFKLVYTGGIRRDRALENTSKAIEDIDMIDFHLAGPIIDAEVFDNIQKTFNIKYHGLLQPHQAISLEGTSDGLIALYNPETIWNRLTLPNKLFEAMMCSIPIVTNVANEIINETKCGILIEYDNIEQIKQAIITLRDNPELRKRLGDNGRKAFLEKYNWNIMEDKLYKVYDDLL